MGNDTQIPNPTASLTNGLLAATTTHTPDIKYQKQPKRKYHLPFV